MAAIIKVENLKKSFKSYQRDAGLLQAVKALVTSNYTVKRALKGISFEVEEGEILGFIGPNGAGKSTAIKALCGVMMPDSGAVTCMGMNPWKDRERYVKNVGAVFGSKSMLWWDLPPIDTFFYHRQLYEIPSKDFARRMAYFTKLLDIESVSKIPVRNLSLGERMKCNLVASLLHNPKIVFLDEPTIGVDIIAKEKIREFIQKVNREEKTTFIITTHDMADIEKLCKRIVIINRGEIVYNGLISKIKDKFANKKVLDIKFSEHQPKFKLHGCKVLLQTEHELQIEVDLRKKAIDDITHYLLKNFKIEDITITNPPIEELIKEIYRR
ncbi:MAG: ATP-binding cassette domain-containing protein [archaeon]